MARIGMETPKALPIHHSQRTIYMAKQPSSALPILALLESRGGANTWPLWPTVESVPAVLPAAAPEGAWFTSVFGPHHLWPFLCLPNVYPAK